MNVKDNIVTLKVTKNHAHEKVIIIGGGIAGSALALFLHKAQVPCAIYEAYNYQDGIGGGLGLAPNGMKVLAQLGLAEKAIARGTIMHENAFYNEFGRVLARISAGDPNIYGQPSVSLMRAALYDILYEEVQSKGIPLEFQKRLKSVTQNADGVTAHFEDGTQATGTLLIGADGVNSQTRRSVLPDAPQPQLVGIIGVGGVVPAALASSVPLREKQSFNFTYGARGFFGYSGTENGDVMWWSNLPFDRELTRAELTDFSLDALKKDMLAIFHDFRAPIETLIENTHQPIKHNIKDIQSLPRWHMGRVLLIGDAAHAVSPNSGQGASLALEDAIYLAKLLRDGDDYAQVFAQFEKERKPRVERIVAEGRRRGNDKAEVSPFQARIRDLMLTIFVNLFGIKGIDWVYRYSVEWDA